MPKYSQEHKVRRERRNHSPDEARKAEGQVRVAQFISNHIPPPNGLFTLFKK